MINLYKGDWRSWIDRLCKDGRYNMIFADPPDNVGLKYEGFNDKMDDKTYARLLWYTIKACTYTDILWVSFNAKHMDLVGKLVYENVRSDNRFNYRFLMQYVSFGYCAQNDFSFCYRPLLRIMRNGAPTYPDAVRIESERQRLGDKRANPRGKIPPDVWAIHRVTGNSKQRRSWHNTQLNEALYERCINFSCKDGDHVCDLYAGTGTIARASLLPTVPQVNVDMIELSDTYCNHLAEEFKIPIHNLES